VAKLYFRYGTVSSAKTLNLLAVAHNYRSQGKKVIVVKPKIDTRFGEDVVESRAGLTVKADVLVDRELPLLRTEDIACILVDEAQFLVPIVIDQLHTYAYIANVPVICYGLRTDFRRQLFDASKRLFELADSIEEVKTTCFYCNRKAVFNKRLVAGEQQVLLGGDDVYHPTCAQHYNKEA
jgi:thymidine kinase